jgi:hypothetical protein
VKKLRQYIRRIDRLPEILTAARTFDRFLPLTLDYLDAKALAYPLDAQLPNGMRVRLVEREDIKVLWHIFVRKCYRVTEPSRSSSTWERTLVFFRCTPR